MFFGFLIWACCRYRSGRKYDDYAVSAEAAMQHRTTYASFPISRPPAAHTHATNASSYTPTGQNFSAYPTNGQNSNAYQAGGTTLPAAAAKPPGY